MAWGGVGVRRCAGWYRLTPRGSHGTRPVARGTWLTIRDSEHTASTPHGSHGPRPADHGSSRRHNGAQPMAHGPWRTDRGSGSASGSGSGSRPGRDPAAHAARGNGIAARHTSPPSRLSRRTAHGSVHGARRAARYVSRTARFAVDFKLTVIICPHPTIARPRVAALFVARLAMAQVAQSSGGRVRCGWRLPLVPVVVRWPDSPGRDRRALRCGVNDDRQEARRHAPRTHEHEHEQVG